MFLARIDGTAVPAKKHATIEGRRLLIGQRIEANGEGSGDPVVLLDFVGAKIGSIVLVTTDGDLARAELGNTTPIRMAVVGIVDSVYAPRQGV